MRGEPSRSSPDSGDHKWYPTPGDPTTSGDAKYNLNPYVWLVHTASNWPTMNGTKAGRIFAYAYSVDDEYGNVDLEDYKNAIIDVGGNSALDDNTPFVPPK
jgi:hypothetical protein